MISKLLKVKTGSKLSVQFGAPLVAMLMLITVPAEAKTPKVSQILNNNGFQTLLFALDTAELTSVLNENTVVLFAPTDDVFEATAEALGCTDVLEFATNLSLIPVGDTNALAYVLTYHAYLGKLIRNNNLLRAGEIQMANGDTAITGVGQNGLNVKGDMNETPSSITAKFKGRRDSRVYAIDQILLPIDPAGVCPS
ncbi:MAG: fasciclin domain-containing protein [Gammaproteobacteria bacterium]